MNSPSILRLGYDNQFILNYNLMFIFILVSLMGMLIIQIRINFLLSEQDEIEEKL
jgi:hypothetical protein